MAGEIEYDEKESRELERVYLAPEIVRQRMRTLEVLGPSVGECIIDVGCGPGLLVHDLAVQVGPEGRIVGVDTSLPMLELAKRRCADLAQVELVAGDASNLTAEAESFDALACVQVLLYITDLDEVLEEFRRVLKPGGRFVVMETDWRGAVLNSTDPAITDKVMAAWDEAVPSPNLPARLGPLLRGHGFTAVNVEAFPILSTSYVREGFSASMMIQIARLVCERGIVGETEIRNWLDGLERLGREDAFFFCVNRFLFSAVKV